MSSTAPVAGRTEQTEQAGVLHSRVRLAVMALPDVEDPGLLSLLGAAGHPCGAAHRSTSSSGSGPAKRWARRVAASRATPPASASNAAIAGPQPAR